MTWSFQPVGSERGETVEELLEEPGSLEVVEHVGEVDEDEASTGVGGVLLAPDASTGVDDLSAARSEGLLVGNELLLLLLLLQ